MDGLASESTLLAAPDGELSAAEWMASNMPGETAAISSASSVNKSAATAVSSSATMSSALNTTPAAAYRFKKRKFDNQGPSPLSRQ